MIPLTPRVYVAALHALGHREPSLQQAPQAAVDGAEHGNAAHQCRHLTRFYHLTDLHFRLKHPCRRCAQYPLQPVAADNTGNPGVGNGCATIEYPPQGVAAHGLHGGVAVLPGGEAGPHANDHRSHCPPGAQVALGQNGIHQSRRI